MKPVLRYLVFWVMMYSFIHGMVIGNSGKQQSTDKFYPPYTWSTRYLLDIIKDAFAPEVELYDSSDERNILWQLYMLGKPIYPTLLSRGGGQDPIRTWC